MADFFGSQIIRGGVPGYRKIFCESVWRQVCTEKIFVVADENFFSNLQSDLVVNFRFARWSVVRWIEFFY